MLYISIIMGVVAVYLFIRLFTYRRELSKISGQLGRYNDFHTKKKIDVSLADQGIEQLGAEINRLIDLYVNAERERIRSERELKQAVANISHDLRTPLTSIKGYIQMAASDDLSEAERREYMDIADARTKRLEQLVDDFFELSRIESADYRLSPETINLKRHFGEVMLGFYNSFEERGIEPEITMPQQGVFMHTDPSALTRILENLLSNAIRYSDGEIRAGITESDDSIVIFAANSAAHIDGSTDLNMLFDRFYAADRSRTDKSTGLGLSIARSLVEKTEGTIRAEYERDMFTVRCEWPKS
ncbi:histidine kinase [Salinicoccus sediminis]|uniref:histidine kinase n=1 Tax=Salinicoccus sediminis TaxID=1432562 RepID=A0A0M2SLV8_9STAP|nr:HAMP domain-containing sensor histidine kinase [Salinicoccus sediminis]KKK33832.1 histidine kinase [Salinicoccus sediminis]